MKIGFVLEPYEERNASGMGFVVSELLKEMLKQGEGHEFVVYSSQPVSKAFIPGEYRQVHYPRRFIKKMWWFSRMPREVEVILFIAPMLPLILPRSIRPIIICQELASQKVWPGVREWPFVFVRDYILMPLSLRRANKVCAASHATEYDLLKFYHLPKNKVEVIYDGYQDLTRFTTVAPQVHESLKPFFFFAGKVKYRKNVHGIATAFADFKTRTKAPAKLVIAGDYGGEYYEQIRQTLRAAGVEQDAHFVGYINNPAQLYAYFKNALAVTFPSINEGFGMPIIEAMSLGTPVITSKISSMAEAAGDAALLVDPFDTTDISRAMERLYLDKPLREELIAKGYRRAKDFSWHKAAKEFLHLIEHES
jgi:glycosyltransferase involved in cell wall biosynthesis